MGAAGRRAIVALVAVSAGIATGALIFKIVGEEQIGSEIGLVAARLGFKVKPGDDAAALDFVEKIAPGTRSGFEGAVLGTVAATLLAACAVTIAVREIAS